MLLRSRLTAERRYLFDLSGSRSLPLYLDYLPSRVTFALFDPLRLVCFDTHLPDRFGIRVLLCTRGSSIKNISANLLFSRLIRSY